MANNGFLMTRQQPIAVLGGGSFGTAIANLLAENGHHVLLWMRDAEQAESIRTLRQNDQAIIEVADTGCGIPAERLETIFDDFVTTKRRGLGLGLAISKKVVEQLSGAIAVTSQVGLGSTFTLRFPLTKARPSKLAVV